MSRKWTACLKNILVTGLFDGLLTDNEKPTERLSEHQENDKGCKTQEQEQTDCPKNYLDLISYKNYTQYMSRGIQCNLETKSHDLDSKFTTNFELSEKKIDESIVINYFKNIENTAPSEGIDNLSVVPQTEINICPEKAQSDYDIKHIIHNCISNAKYGSKQCCSKEIALYKDVACQTSSQKNIFDDIDQSFENFKTSRISYVEEVLSEMHNIDLKNQQFSNNDDLISRTCRTYSRKSK